MDNEFDQYERVFLIENSDPTAGICLCMMFALNGALFAKSKNWLPVVKFDNNDNPYRDLRFGNNIWDYYFEPIGGLSYDDLRLAVEQNQLDPLKVLKISDFVPPGAERGYQFQMHFAKGIFEHFERVATFPWGRADLTGDALQAWMLKKRQLGRSVVTECLKPKPHILRIVEDYVAGNFAGRFVYGVQIRGTDFGYALPTRPEQYYEFLDAALEHKPDAAIFVATDQLQLLRSFEERYGDRVISSSCRRTEGVVAPHMEDDSDNYKRGEEALVDCLLLSRTDFLLKCAAAIGEFALYFNPDLECQDFAVQSRYTPGTKYRREAYYRLFVDPPEPEQESDFVKRVIGRAKQAVGSIPLVGNWSRALLRSLR